MYLTIYPYNQVAILFHVQQKHIHLSLSLSIYIYIYIYIYKENICSYLFMILTYYFYILHIVTFHMLAGGCIHLCLALHGSWPGQRISGGQLQL